MNDPIIFNGMRIQESRMAVRLKTVVHVRRHPISKRRRRWQVVVEVVETPCAFVMEGLILMHPLLLAGLREQLRGRVSHG